MAGNGAVRGLGFDGLAVGGHEHRGHQTQRAKALRYGIRLDVTVVVLTRPDKAAGPLQRSGYHVVDQAVFVGDARLGELVFELGFEDMLEQVFEPAVVLLHDRVLGRQVHGPTEVEAVVHARPGEANDRLIEVVHAHGNPGFLEVENRVLDRLAAVGRLEHHLQVTRPGYEEIGRAVLVTKGVTADDDRLGPAGNQTRYVGHDDRLAENRTTEDVADGAVGRAVHLLQPELFDPRLVRGDGRTLDADPELLDRVGRVDGDLVVGLVATLHAQIVVLQVHVEVRQDQPVLDERPDDAGHLITIELDDGGLDANLGHGCSLLQHGLFVFAPDRADPERANSGAWLAWGPGGDQTRSGRHWVASDQWIVANGNRQPGPQAGRGKGRPACRPDNTQARDFRSGSALVFRPAVRPVLRAAHRDDGSTCKDYSAASAESPAPRRGRPDPSAAASTPVLCRETRWAWCAGQAASR